MNDHYSHVTLEVLRCPRFYKFVLKRFLHWWLSITIFWYVTMWSEHRTDISEQCHNTSTSLKSTTCHKTVIFKHYMSCVWIWNTWEIANLHCGWWRDDVQWWVQYALAWCALGPLVPDAHSLHPVHCHIQSTLYCVCPAGKLRLFEC